MDTLKKVLPSCLLVVISLLIGYGIAADRYKTEPVEPISYEKRLESTTSMYTEGYPSAPAWCIGSRFPLWQTEFFDENRLYMEVNGIVSDGSPIEISFKGMREETDPYFMLVRGITALPEGASMRIWYADTQDNVLAEKTFNLTPNKNS